MAHKTVEQNRQRVAATVRRKRYGQSKGERSKLRRDVKLDFIDEQVKAGVPLSEARLNYRKAMHSR